MSEVWVMMILQTVPDRDALIRQMLSGDPIPELYLRSFDPDGLNGFGDIVTTLRVAEAKRFACFADVMEEWKRESTVRPLRHDGKPNRPLTSLSIEPRRIG